MPFPYLLTQRQQAIVAKADELAATFAERAVIHDPAGSFPHENYRDLHDAGFLRLAIPREYGGEGPMSSTPFSPMSVSGAGMAPRRW